MSSSNNEFITVHRRKRGDKRISRRKNDVASCLESTPEIDHELIREGLRLSRLSLKESEFTRRDLVSTFTEAGLLKTVHNKDESLSLEPSASIEQRVQQLVCYGLGNFSICPIARYQLALIGWLLEIFDLSNTSSAACWLYDPRFTTNERSFLVSLGYNLIEINEEAKHRSVVHTLYYMPHCDRPLYNNLLWANWSPSALERTIILGNSFTRMTDTGRCYESSNPPGRPSRGHKSQLTDHVIAQAFDRSVDTCTYVLRVLPYTREYSCTNSFVHNDVFNDTALHVFTRKVQGQRTVAGVIAGDQFSEDENSSWPELDSSFWTVNDEPIYCTDDVEIITAALSNI